MSNLSLSTMPPPTAAPPRRQPWYYWRRWGFNFLTISILAHLLFGVVATYFIVQTIQAKRKQTFAAPAGGPSAPTRALEHKVQMQKKQQTMSAPAAVRRITTNSNVTVALPAMPAVSTASVVAPLAMAGMGGTGVGLGLGSNGGGSGNGTGTLNFFGLRSGTAGLEGTFYDYKMTQSYQPIKRGGLPAYGQLIREVLPLTGPWHPEQPFPHFSSPVKLHARYLIFPEIRDTEAGKAFQSPRSGPGLWLAVYRGKVSAPSTGSFRFVAFGDNVMIVQIDNRMVFDGSDRNYTGMKRENVGHISFNGDNKGLVASDWIELNQGEAHDIAITVGDEGGVFASGLFFQPKGMQYAQGARGVPKLPVFMLGPPTDGDRKLLEAALLPECLRGPYFRDASAGGSIFSH